MAYSSFGWKTLTVLKLLFDITATIQTVLQNVDPCWLSKRACRKTAWSQYFCHGVIWKTLRGHSNQLNNFHKQCFRWTFVKTKGWSNVETVMAYCVWHKYYDGKAKSSQVYVSFSFSLSIFLVPDCCHTKLHRLSPGDQKKRSSESKR